MEQLIQNIKNKSKDDILIYTQQPDNKLSSYEKILLTLYAYNRSEIENLILFYKDDDLSHNLHRFYFMFYLQVKFIYNNPSSNIEGTNQIKKLFFNYLELLIAPYINNELSRKITELYNLFHDYFYDTFFNKHNIYYHTYFNNLIKYFLPLPYDILEYYPIVTYRNNVTGLYKKNNLDFIENPIYFDNLPRQNLFKECNINITKNEIDIHVPLKLLNWNLFKNKLFLLAVKKTDTSYDLLIATDISYVNNDQNILINKIRYTRHINFKQNRLMIDAYTDGLSFEFCFPPWNIHSQQYNEYLKNPISINSVVYVSIYDKITKYDLLNFCNIININKDNYSYLFKNTVISYENRNDLQELINYPSFFEFAPYQANNSNCLIYKINNNINDILDLTSNITKNNPVRKFLFQSVCDNNVSKSCESCDVIYNMYNLSGNNILDYYNDKLNKYSTYLPHNNDISDQMNKFIENAVWCDIGYKNQYTGRKKYQEIVYKTRKYRSGEIWIYNNLHKNIQDKYDQLINNYFNNSYYELYHPTKLININFVPIDNYDAIFLKNFNIKGFYFVNYDININSGGELFLLNPKKYINLAFTKRNSCASKEEQLESV
jgi:hypothetical protein